ncbi:hypothetical protein AMECASPLE_030962, partial [Ameca splendens]
MLFGSFHKRTGDVQASKILQPSGSKSQLWILPQSELQIIQETCLAQVLADSSSLPPSTSPELSLENSPPPWTDSQTWQLYSPSSKLIFISIWCLQPR